MQAAQSGDDRDSNPVELSAGELLADQLKRAFGVDSPAGLLSAISRQAVRPDQLAVALVDLLSMVGGAYRHYEQRIASPAVSSAESDSALLAENARLRSRCDAQQAVLGALRDALHGLGDERGVAAVERLAADELAQSLSAVVSERRETSLLLGVSEERLKLALDSSEDGIWDWDVATGAVHFSVRWASMLGLTLDEVPPTVEGWQALVHPDDLPQVQARLDDNVSGAATDYDCEFRMRTQRGEWKWILARGKVVKRDA